MSEIEIYSQFNLFLYYASFTFGFCLNSDGNGTVKLLNFVGSKFHGLTTIDVQIIFNVTKVNISLGS